MSKILVTGANGFVAVHIVSQLISSGHHVVGVFRTLSKGTQLLALHPSFTPSFEIAVVPDYAAPGAWDELFQTHDIEYVFHTAATIYEDPYETIEDFDKEYLEPTVKPNLELLTSATKYGKNVKRIVFTGSLGEVVPGNEDKVLMSDTWTTFTPELAREKRLGFIAYVAAKTTAERALWDYMNSKSPSYSATVLLPGYIMGPVLSPVSNMAALNYSSGEFWKLLDGKHEVIPPTPFPTHIDVRDLAQAHILALDNPHVANHRVIVGGEPYSTQNCVDVLKKHTEFAHRLPKKDEQAKPDTELRFGDVKEWNSKLGLELRTAEETFVDTARALVELEGKLEGKSGRL